MAGKPMPTAAAVPAAAPPRNLRRDDRVATSLVLGLALLFMCVSPGFVGLLFVVATRYKFSTADAFICYPIGRVNDPEAGQFKRGTAGAIKRRKHKLLLFKNLCFLCKSNC